MGGGEPGEGVRLIHGDCLAVLPTLEAGSVNHIVTDPPYGQTNESYDSAVAFDATVWRECFRVARDDAALISFAGSPTYHRIATAIEAGGWKVRQMWGWVYRDGLITSAWPKEGFDRLAPAMDPIVYATKGKVILSLDRVSGEDWHRPPSPPGSYSERSLGGPAKARNGHWPRSIVSDGTEPFEYFALSRSGWKPDVTGHPNQKPVKLLEWLVGKLPNGLILDPFAGSASTGVACLNLGYGFVGIESDPGYAAIARKRLDSALNQTPLFSPAGSP